MIAHLSRTTIDKVNGCFCLLIINLQVSWREMTQTANVSFKDALTDALPQQFDLVSETSPVPVDSENFGNPNYGYLGFVYPRVRVAGSLPIYRRYTYVHEPRLEDYKSKTRTKPTTEKPHGKNLGDDRSPPAHASFPSQTPCITDDSIGDPFFRCTNWWSVFKFRLVSKVFLGRVFINTMTSFWVFASSMLAGMSAWLAFQLELSANLPITVMASAIIFPVSFGISLAASRRERVLLDMASLKTNVLEIYILARNWTAIEET